MADSVDSSIEKIATYDDRVVQSPARYAIIKGANSINSMPFRAQTESVAQHQYTIQVPNQGVYMDRALLWTSTCNLKITVTRNPLSIGYAATGGKAVAPFGSALSLAAFPLHRLINTVNGTINNQNVTFNCDVLNEVLRLVDSPGNRSKRTCATSLEWLADMDVAGGGTLGPLTGVQDVTDRSTRSAGSWPQVYFTKADGTQPLGGTGPSDQLSYTFVNGIPTWAATGTGDVAILYFRFTSTEKFVLSPFIFADLCDRDTGIFGLNNVMLTLNMTAPSMTGHVGRVLRASSTYGQTYSDLGYNTGQGISTFQNSTINVQFLDPNWEVPLPTRSMVPYMDYARYLTFTKPGGGLPPRSLHSGVFTQTITLSYIPDLIAISVRPAHYGDLLNNSQQSTIPNIPHDLAAADYCFPIQQLSLQWANRSGLLSTHTPEQLYEMAYANGLHMTWEEWSGLGKLNIGSTGQSEVKNLDGNGAMVGGFLVLRPGVDFVLDPGQAPGMVGNFVLNANLKVFNQFVDKYDGDLRLSVVAVNSGFFATVYGTSAIMRGVLSPADVAAQGTPSTTEFALSRVVGGGFLERLANGFTKMKDHAGTLLSVAKAAKPMLPKSIQDAMTAMGHGYAASGGGIGEVGGKRTRLAARADEYY